jgi:Gas vesicle synthesis protein GvpL/GvpF
VSAELYVYGVTRAGAPAPHEGGVDGERARLYVHGDLAAIVGPAPAGPVAPSRRNLDAHTAVLRAVMRSAPVASMRFGVVMPQEALERDLLEAARESLVELLLRLDGLVELELKVVYDEDAVLREVIAGEPRLMRMRERLRGSAEDATYYDRIRLGELVAEGVERARAARAERILEALRPHAVELRVSDEVPERVALKASFLVEEDAVARFERAAEGVAAEAAPAYKCHLFGPLPPFSFVELGDVEAAWAS